MTMTNPGRVTPAPSARPERIKRQVNERTASTATTATTSATSTTSTKKKQVHWNTKCKVTIFQRTDEMDKPAVWYNASDYASFKRSAKVIARLMKEMGIEVVESRMDESMRGLENFINEKRELLCVIRQQRAWKAVLDEQQRQKKQDEEHKKLMSSCAASASMSSTSKRLASMRQRQQQLRLAIMSKKYKEVNMKGVEEAMVQGLLDYQSVLKDRNDTLASQATTRKPSTPTQTSSTPTPKKTVTVPSKAVPQQKRRSVAVPASAAWRQPRRGSTTESEPLVVPPSRLERRMVPRSHSYHASVNSSSSPTTLTAAAPLVASEA